MRGPLLLQVLLLAPQPLAAQTADLVLRGGKVITVDAAGRIAQAVAVEFTIWAAYGGYEERVKGSIEPGKLADLVVLSGDPLTVVPERLTDLHADLVILDGKVAYERPAKRGSK